MSEQRRRLIFIAGADHSGSTLVGCILGATPSGPHEIFHVGEAHAFFNPAHKQFGRPNRPVLERGHSSVWSSISPQDAPYPQIFDTTGASIVVDSSKTLRWLKSLAQQCQIEGWQLDIVITMRDFASIEESAKRRGVSSRLVYYERLLDLLPDLPTRRIITVDATDLCRAPASQVRRLCETLEIPYFAGKERYWEFPSDHLYGARRQVEHYRDPASAGYHLTISAAQSQQTDVERRLREAGHLIAEPMVRQSP